MRQVNLSTKQKQIQGDLEDELTVAEEKNGENG